MSSQTHRPLMHRHFRILCLLAVGPFLGDWPEGSPGTKDTHPTKDARLTKN